MSKPEDEGILSFVDRCLGSADTGKRYLSRRDQDQLRKDFAMVGRDVNRPFRNEAELLRTYLRTVDDAKCFLIYEHLRLRDPALADPLDNLETMTGMGRRKYLVIRILAKLNYLTVDLDALDHWVREHIGAQYLDDTGRIAFEDEALMLALDRMLASRIATTSRSE